MYSDKPTSSPEPIELGFSPAARAGMNLVMAATVDTVAHAMRQREAEQAPQTFTRNGDGTWSLEAG